jgi:hypothetical protein
MGAAAAAADAADGLVSNIVGHVPLGVEYPVLSRLVGYGRHVNRAIGDRVERASAARTN